MKKTLLYFNKEDEALDRLSGFVTWRDDSPVNMPDCSIRGLGKWRHFPGNLLACSDRAIDLLKLATKGQRLSKCGVNYVGLESKTDIMISKSLREGRNGSKKVVELLKKFFIKGLGASSVQIKIEKSTNSDENGEQ